MKLGKLQIAMITVCVLESVLMMRVVTAQKQLSKIWRDELKLHFLIEPVRNPQVFGVGAIIRGNGKSFYPDCYTDRCLPDKNELVQRGEIKLDPYPHKKLELAKTTKPFLRLLKLDLKRNKYRYVKIEFDDPIQEQVDGATIKSIWDRLTPEGRDFLDPRKRPHRELVIFAVRCKRLKFSIHDETGGKISIPKPSIGAGWEQIDEFSGLFEDVWIGVKTAALKKGPPPDSISEDLDYVLGPSIMGTESRPRQRPQQEVVFHFEDVRPRLGLRYISPRN